VAARRMTRAWSFSASRMPAKTAAPVTSVTLPTMMTASSRAGSTTCSTCRVGWRRSGSSSPAISTPAADRPAVQRAAAVEENHAETPRHAVARQKGLVIPDAVADQATNAEAVSRPIKPVCNANRFNQSPRRKPGDSGAKHRLAGRADPGKDQRPGVPSLPLRAS
jgi:hypothetical protein